MHESAEGPAKSYSQTCSLQQGFRQSNLPHQPSLVQMGGYLIPVAHVATLDDSHFPTHPG